jgi:phosphoglycerol transferase
MQQKKTNFKIISLFLGVIALIVYLTFRNAGLYPMVFADEWFYNAYSRYMPIEGSPRPNYLFFYLYKQAPDNMKHF